MPTAPFSIRVTYASEGVFVECVDANGLILATWQASTQEIAAGVKSAKLAERDELARERSEETEF